jgi:hypothetical protein
MCPGRPWRKVCPPLKSELCSLICKICDVFRDSVRIVPLLGASIVSDFVRRVRVSTPSGAGPVGCRCTNGDSPDSAPRCPRSDSFHTRLCRRPRLRLVCTLAASDGEARGSSNGKARQRGLLGGGSSVQSRRVLVLVNSHMTADVAARRSSGLSAAPSPAQPCVSKRDGPLSGTCSRTVHV